MYSGVSLVPAWRVVTVALGTANGVRNVALFCFAAATFTGNCEFFRFVGIIKVTLTLSVLVPWGFSGLVMMGVSSGGSIPIQCVVSSPYSKWLAVTNSRLKILAVSLVPLTPFVRTPTKSLSSLCITSRLGMIGLLSETQCMYYLCNKNICIFIN